MQISTELTNGQIDALQQAELMELEAHKLRVRSGLPAAVPYHNAFALTTQEVVATAIWACRMYWKIAQANARKEEWDEALFWTPLRAIAGEFHLLRKALAIIIEGKDPSEIRQDIQSRLSSFSV